ncbi:hypothetical protein LTR09_004133 [Extremus antarcticus]|uniref:Uncharacterized protein n=1 Tax=Extremus antarcticus TaxID=702011 RepID=A0AAJ0G9Z5_9PEZI|nr:hypothetical protein LTR09_004133 [Extremus antarcticus]
MPLSSLTFPAFRFSFFRPFSFCFCFCFLESSLLLLLLLLHHSSSHIPGDRSSEIKPDRKTHPLRHQTLPPAIRFSPPFRHNDRSHRFTTMSANETTPSDLDAMDEEMRELTLRICDVKDKIQKLIADGQEGEAGKTEEAGKVEGSGSDQKEAEAHKRIESLVEKLKIVEHAMASVEGLLEAPMMVIAKRVGKMDAMVEYLIEVEGKMDA